MENQDDIQKELAELSPKLRQIKEKGAGFKVPDNYFKQLPDDLLQQLAAEAAPSKAVQPHWLDQLLAPIIWILQPRYAMALASGLILIVAAYFLLRPQAVDEVFVQDLTETEISNYIADNIEDFDLNLLIEAGGVELDMVPEVTSPEAPIEEELDEYLDEIIEDLDLDELEDLL